MKEIGPKAEDRRAARSEAASCWDLWLVVEAHRCNGSNAIVSQIAFVPLHEGRRTIYHGTDLGR